MKSSLVALLVLAGLVRIASAADAPLQFPPDSYFQLSNGSLCIARKSSAREVELKSCDKADPYQAWRFEPTVYKERERLLVHDKPTGNCLEVSGGSSVDGGGIAVWSCSKIMNSQFWEALPAADGSYLLKVDHSRKCLTIKEVQRKNEPQQRKLLVQWACGNNDGQGWNIEPLPAGAYAK